MHTASSIAKLFKKHLNFKEIAKQRFLSLLEEGEIDRAKKVM